MQLAATWMDLDGIMLSEVSQKINKGDLSYLLYIRYLDEDMQDIKGGIHTSPLILKYS